MSLGIKQLTPDPWADIETRYPVGTKCKAKVRNFTNFGVFVEIEEGIDGLIHISDLSWTKKIKHPGEFTSVGAEIEVVVLEVDKENRRLSLGHKQLEENPWNEFEGQFSVDSVHEGTITEMTDKGAIVSLGENVEGFAPMRQLVKEDGTTATVGEKLPFKVIEFSKATKRITLSHTRLFEEAKTCRARRAGCRKKGFCRGYQVFGEEDQRFGREDHAGRHRRSGRTQGRDGSGCQGGEVILDRIDEKIPDREAGGFFISENKFGCLLYCGYRPLAL